MRGLYLFIIAILTVCISVPIAKAQTTAHAPTQIVESGDSSLITKGHPAAKAAIIATPGVIPRRVLWMCSRYVFGKSSSWTEPEAKTLLFKPLDITATEIIFNGMTCTGVHFVQNQVDTVAYLATTWQVTPPLLGITAKTIQIVKTDCEIPGFQEYLRLSGGRLILPINGVFFFFEPEVSR